MSLDPALAGVGANNLNGRLQRESFSGFVKSLEAFQIRYILSVTAGYFDPLHIGRRAPWYPPQPLWAPWLP